MPVKMASEGGYLLILTPYLPDSNQKMMALQGKDSVVIFLCRPERTLPFQVQTPVCAGLAACLRILLKENAH